MATEDLFLFRTLLADPANWDPRLFPFGAPFAAPRAWTFPLGHPASWRRRLQVVGQGEIVSTAIRPGWLQNLSVVLRMPLFATGLAHKASQGPPFFKALRIPTHLFTLTRHRRRSF